MISSGETAVIQQWLETPAPRAAPLFRRWKHPAPPAADPLAAHTAKAVYHWLPPGPGRGMVRALVPRIAAVREDGEHQRRLWLLRDWLVRTLAPVMLETVPELEGLAGALRELDPLTGPQVPARVMVAAHEARFQAHRLPRSHRPAYQTAAEVAVYGHFGGLYLCEPLARFPGEGDGRRLVDYVYSIPDSCARIRVIHALTAAGQMPSDASSGPCTSTPGRAVHELDALLEEPLLHLLQEMLAAADDR
ncbi:hypothetical protein [Streptomyces qinglanensis]|uniref:hypothetical protein n=1 Tax=Streptomyces qinglanensis TaxID=943816 RepID=UPI003D733F14